MQSVRTRAWRAWPLHSQRVIIAPATTTIVLEGQVYKGQVVQICFKGIRTGKQAVGSLVELDGTDLAPT